jgi:hypothetical protein
VTKGHGFPLVILISSSSSLCSKIIKDNNLDKLVIWSFIYIRNIHFKIIIYPIIFLRIHKIHLCILNWSHLQLMGHKLFFLDENQNNCKYDQYKK